MKSMMTIVPSSVVSSVSSVSEPSGTRGGRADRATGAIFQNPFSSLPRSAAKHASESKRGRQSQSIDPSSADERSALAVTEQRIVLDARASS